MTSSGHSSSRWQLYVIVDRQAVGGRDPVWIAEQAVRGGADVIQLRDKSGLARDVIALARAMRRAIAPFHVPLIVNDRPDVALAADADGVHLGQDDVPVEVARRILGPKRLIGRSTHSVEQALAADREAIDYLASGPLFATPTKPDYGCIGLDVFRRVRASVHTPLVAIGGIDAETVELVRGAGASCIAVVRAACAADDPADAARRLKRVMQRVAGGAGGSRTMEP